MNPTFVVAALAFALAGLAGCADAPGPDLSPDAGGASASLAPTPADAADDKPARNGTPSEATDA